MKTRLPRAFTLIEVLIAIALAGLVMVGLNFFVFSMGEVWGRGSDRRLFDQHVRAVTRYLDRELRGAALPPAALKGENAFTPLEIKPSGGMPETLLSYEQLESNRLVKWPDRPLPEIVCSLQVREGKGLYLLWHSRLESRFDDDPPREVLISPLVSGLSYQYYDPEMKRWSLERTLKRDASNKYLAPQRLVFKFSYKGLVRETLLTLPTAKEGLPTP